LLREQGLSSNRGELSSIAVADRENSLGNRVSWPLRTMRRPVHSLSIGIAERTILLFGNSSDVIAVIAIRLIRRSDLIFKAMAGVAGAGQKSRPFLECC
jgi:hypothetical protein